MGKYKEINHQDIELKLGCDLAKYSTIKLSAKGNMAIVKSEDAIVYLIPLLKKKSLTFQIVAWGSNQVLTGEIDLYIKLELPQNREELKSLKDVYQLNASTSILSMVTTAKKLGLVGWDVLTGIPASLGGAICMNAGTSLGDIAPLVESVRVLTPDGKIIEKNLNTSDFQYRRNLFLETDEIILSAKIRHLGTDENLAEKINNYLDKRNQTQPLKTKNCGSVFKNNKPFIAGKIIDTCGLKGFGLENIHVSFMHANFIEHTGNGRAKEFKNMTDALIEEIERFSGQKFELEVKIV